ncbi:Flagellar basal body rod protein FlgB [Ignavibacterium album JCM 16511]|uniref:Flagellar basal body rod protein FlgB n=1 Tax=Ignavibacterium album (strain DSM 19864 / JCM 16511 / NBRC 101810 / Mat9-16) TaxID=945713 RepID=I0AMP3_IGNAJ|nr:flagellar basal body rod protein FlgB [Ignavibacterium album]AFH50250.1 Flagellar basal body rod protein FlgB [Ignavibacterium album JCM 16511]
MNTPTIKLLEKFIDYCSVKNKVISKNIANIGTENYRREDVSFQEMLDTKMNQLRTTNPKHISFLPMDDSQFQIYKDKGMENVSGVNNVDIDKEMSELASNALLFRFSSKKIGDYYRGLQNVIKGGGKL